MLLPLVRRAVRPDVDVELAPWTLACPVGNCLQAGLLTSDGKRNDTRRMTPPRCITCALACAGSPT
ncbi:hypothetical protein SAMN04489712_12213 [Thermomonospora echinospora]|uniref:Uncharacterized protein n=1 Tax=Thermomonospora echinospora TaxID=1992 RepID=A0A1H6DT66_9ACTN|nr:hypothetical protein [Thermomonospora echinospora]SEG88491.1 hypothetical protein SAMN04489712_12213 [Thermomonospora echinospora]